MPPRAYEPKQFNCPIHPEKQRWSRESKARKMAQAASLKVGHLMRAYRCPGCGDYHLTKQMR